MTTPASSIILVLGASVIGSVANVFLKAGASRLRREILSVVANWRLAAGVITYLASSFLYIKGIKNGELTILYPMASIGQICTLFWSRLVFAEPLTKEKFIALGFIVMGICLLAYGNK